ncbi:SRPBCC domain-containing protein [Peribacillus sp. SCS-155]|uniref:SRPBCC domain-containing protein n=1 Tax=Peribacillus sedimenti TaxID=3115297 RepID=UPI0039064A3A
MAENQETRIKWTVDGRNLVLERVFVAPRELVFRAFSNPELLQAWWGPKGWQTEIHKFEFKPDGIWFYTMTCMDKKQGDFYGQESRGKAVYHKITPPETIIYTDTFADEEGNSVDGMPGMLITMNFIEQEGKTNVISNSQFASVEQLQQVIEMGVIERYSSQMDRLEILLKELQ